MPQNLILCKNLKQSFDFFFTLFLFILKRIRKKNYIKGKISKKKKNCIEKIEIFDDNNSDIIPLAWGRKSQIATCKNCGKTGLTLIKKKFGAGNICCSFCFFTLCIWCVIPFVCCIASDTMHLCSHCNSTIGIRSFI